MDAKSHLNRMTRSPLASKHDFKYSFGIHGSAKGPGMIVDPGFNIYKKPIVNVDLRADRMNSAGAVQLHHRASVSMTYG